MKRFYKLCSLSLQGALFYRAAFFFNLLTPLIVLGGQFVLWHCLYNLSDTGRIGQYTRPVMYTYILLSFLINNLLTWSSENSISREIRKGSIVSRCVRPVPFITQSLADLTGKMLPQAAVNFALVGALFLVFASGLAVPAPGNLLLGLFSLLLGLLLRMLLVSCFSLLCFFTTSHLGLSWTRTALTEFFSGALIPVSLFPDWLRTVSYCTPFPLMVQTPISLLLGEQTALPVWLGFALQLLWSAVFLLAHHVLYRRIRRNLCFAGG